MTTMTLPDLTNMVGLLDAGWPAERLGQCPYCRTDIVWRSPTEFAEHVMACALIDQGVALVAEARKRVKR